MNKAPRGNKDGGGPPVIRFEARLLRHPEATKADSCALLYFPKSVSKKFPSRGLIAEHI